MRSPPILIAAQAAVVREFPTAMGVADRDSEAVLSAFGCPPRDVDSAVIGQGCPHETLHEDLPRAGASDEKLCGLRALGRAKAGGLSARCGGSTTISSGSLRVPRCCRSSGCWRTKRATNTKKTTTEPTITTRKPKSRLPRSLIALPIPQRRGQCDSLAPTPPAASRGSHAERAPLGG